MLLSASRENLHGPQSTMASQSTKIVNVLTKEMYRYIKEDQMRVGLVGAGGMMQITHLPSLLQIADVELVAVAELDRARAEALAAAYGIPRILGSAEELAAHAELLDCAVVVTLKEHHAAAIIPFLEAGVPVFTEKPLAGSRADAERIHAASERTGTPVMVGYMRQFDPAVQLAKQLLEKGSIGDVCFAQFRDFGGNWQMGAATLHSLPIAPPPAKLPAAFSASSPSQPESIERVLTELIEVWVHDVNMMRHLLGDPQGVRFASLGPPRLAVLDYGAHETVLEVGRSTYANAPWDQAATIYGTEGRIDLVHAPPLLFRQPSALTLHTPTGSTRLDVPAREAFTEEIRYFLRCVQQGSIPTPDTAEGVADFALCEQIVGAATQPQS